MPTTISTPKVAAQRRSEYNSPSRGGLFEIQGNPSPNSLHASTVLRVGAASDRIVPFDMLSTSDLHLEAVYVGGTTGNVNDDPLQHLVKGASRGVV